MRVGLIVYGNLNTISGGYLYDRQLVRHLREQGDEVDLISLPWVSYDRHLLHNLDRKLLQRLRDASYDVLLQDELNHPSLFLINRRLPSAARFPVVSIVHHLRSSERHKGVQLIIFRWIERLYLQTIDGFIYNSMTTQVAAETMLGRSRPHIVAYPAGNPFLAAVDRSYILKRVYSAGPLRLLFVGNLIPRKGLHVLLTALVQLAPDSWQLTAVGDPTLDPTYSRRIKKQAIASGFESQIAREGQLSDAALTQKMADSHLLVVPSSYEGFGIVYLEGMGHGLPAIATTTGAAHEVIDDGETGFLIAADDAMTLAKRIQVLHEDRPKLARMSLSARERYKRHPSWEASMASVRHFLTGISR
jgi:glycosyltransferase involved in cell wall biosynthesis